MSFGVVEHVGTSDGHAKLLPNHNNIRHDFLVGQIKLLKNGGTLIVACPNRLFPFDFQHGPHTYGLLKHVKNVFKSNVVQKMTNPFHPDNFLLSWYDIRNILAVDYSNADFLAPKQTDLLALSSLSDSPRLKKLFRYYTTAVDRLPFALPVICSTHTLFVMRLR